MINKIDSTEEDDAGANILHREAEKKPPRSWRYWLIGRPLPTADAPHQTIGKAIGLAVFAGDALSSVAYVKDIAAHMSAKDRKMIEITTD